MKKQLLMIAVFGCLQLIMSQKLESSVYLQPLLYSISAITAEGTRQALDANSNEIYKSLDNPAEKEMFQKIYLDKQNNTQEISMISLAGIPLGIAQLGIKSPVGATIVGCAVFICSVANIMTWVYLAENKGRVEAVIDIINETRRKK